ncbi:MAG: glycosyltransferase [Candidatus Tectomicrobia bacterium]|nr:glycosyltransferase [Candidatus Tectomicrobia bacterium]
MPGALRSGKPTGISLCMIVRNEAERLGGFLRHHRPLVQEVVVVDTGSRDATRQIAAAHGARLFEFPWCDDFSAARNASLRAARFSWVLVLDADEQVPVEEFSRVRALLAMPRFTAAYFRIVNVDPDGTPLGMHVAVRMFRNTPGVRFRGAIHEEVGVRGEALATSLRIVHTGYRADPQAMRPKLERDRRLLLKSLAAEPANPAYRYYLARTCYLLGDWQEGLRQASQARAALAAEPAPGSLALLTAHLEAVLLWRQGELAQAEECCRRLLHLRDDYLDAHFLLAKVCLQRRRLREARRALERYLALLPRFSTDAAALYPFGMLTTLSRGAEALNELAGLAHRSGDTRRALGCLAEAAQLDAAYAPTYLNWGLALLAQGREEEAAPKFKEALARAPDLHAARHYGELLERRLPGGRSAARKLPPLPSAPSTEEERAVEAACLATHVSEAGMLRTNLQRSLP